MKEYVEYDVMGRKVFSYIFPKLPWSKLGSREISSGYSYKTSSGELIFEKAEGVMMSGDEMNGKVQAFFIRLERMEKLEHV
jgi:hypothetical protein